MKKLALFDLDKTIYNNHSFFELVQLEVENGIVSEKTWLVIQKLLQKYKSGKQPYSETANQLLEVYSESLKGLKIKKLLSDTIKYFENNKSNFYPYFNDVLDILNQSYDIYIITTNAQYVAQAVCKIFDLKGYIASEFEVENDLFTGRVLKSLAEGKAVVNDLLSLYKNKDSIAVGDSENDIGMLEMVKYPLCINPSKKLSGYAKNKGWKIVSETTIEDEILKIVRK